MKQLFFVFSLFISCNYFGQICFGGDNYYGAGANPWSTALADYNLDGKTDIAVANFSPGDNFTILTGVGDGTFQYAGMFPSGSGTSGITSGDFNSDGKPDIAVSNYSVDSVNVFLGNGSGNFVFNSRYLVGVAPYGIICKDINADGKLDLLTANSTSNNISVMFGVGNGTFLPASNFSTDIGPVALVCKDFNTDGKLDVAVATSGLGLSVLFNDGVGGFLPSSDFPTGNSSNSIVAADFNQDGKIDIATANVFSNDISILLGMGNGMFNPSTNINVGNQPYSLCVSDFNNDSKFDLAVANYGSNDVSILEGLGNGNFNSALTLTGSNLPMFITSSDFNGDNNIDLVAVDNGFANVYLNNMPRVTISGDTTVCNNHLVTLTANGCDNYLWSANAGGASTDVVSFLSPANATTYTVYASNNGCSDTTQAMVTLTANPVPVPQICMVTVDDPGNNNIIYWDKTNYGMADTFYVYREITNNNYQIIGKVPYDSLSMCVDTVRTLYFPSTGNPRSFSYRYKLAIKDTCGNLGSKSLYHGTMFLQDQGNGNFNWTHYEIEGQTSPVSQLTSYLFLRDNDLDFIYETTIGSTTNNLATDFQYLTYQFTADWRIETNWNISCNPTMRLTNGNEVNTALVKSKSNVRNNRSIGIKSDPSINSGFKVYPNPATDLLNVEFLMQNEKEATITIENMLGQFVYTMQTNKPINSINTSNLMSGVYFVKVNTGKDVVVEKVILE